jgi:hypothetical protein
MSMQFTAREPSRQAKSWASDRRMCRRLVIASMPVFLVATALRRVLRPAPSGSRLSIYAEARASANATIPFMFMG